MKYLRNTGYKVFPVNPVTDNKIIHGEPVYKKLTDIKDHVGIVNVFRPSEEAEEIADRVGVINKGELLLIEGKNELMQRMGSKNLTIELQSPATEIPSSLSHYNLTLSDDGLQLYYQYDVRAQKTGIVDLLSELRKASFRLRDLQTSQSSLEEIFVNLVRD